MRRRLREIVTDKCVYMELARRILAKDVLFAAAAIGELTGPENDGTQSTAGQFNKAIVFTHMKVIKCNNWSPEELLGRKTIERLSSKSTALTLQLKSL